MQQQIQVRQAMLAAPTGVEMTIMTGRQAPLEVTVSNSKVNNKHKYSTKWLYAWFIHRFKSSSDKEKMRHLQARRAYSAEVSSTERQYVKMGIHGVRRLYHIDPILKYLNGCNIWFEDLYILWLFCIEINWIGGMMQETHNDEWIFFY